MSAGSGCLVCGESGAGGPLGAVRGQLDALGVRYLTCPSGHRTAIVYREPRYAVWLRAGAHALLTGAPTEAIVSASIALDCVGELYARVVWRVHGIAQEQVDAAWSAMCGSSPRQTGALGALLLLDTGQPLAADAGMTSLRDRVLNQRRGRDRATRLGPVAARWRGAAAPDGLESVTQSRRASRELEARHFGAHVFAITMTVEHALERHAGAMAIECERELQRRLDSIPAGMRHEAVCMTAVDMDRGGSARPAWSFEDYLNAVHPADSGSS
jgi:hypothetical protein